MKSLVSMAAIAAALSASAASAATTLAIDDFSVPVAVSRMALGTSTATAGDAGAIGDRTVSVEITGNAFPSTFGGSTLIANGLGYGIQQDPGVSGNHEISYGLATSMNLDISSFDLIQYSLTSLDQAPVDFVASFTSGKGTLGETTESITTTFNTTTMTAVDFSSSLSSLTMVDLTDIDELTFSFSGTAIDLTIESIGFTTAVPVPAALPLMAAALGGLAFLRRRA